MDKNYNLNEKKPETIFLFKNNKEVFNSESEIIKTVTTEDKILNNNYEKKLFYNDETFKNNLKNQLKNNSEGKDDFDSSLDFCTIDSISKFDENNDYKNVFINKNNFSKGYNLPPKRSELSNFMRSPILKTLDTFNKISHILIKEDYPNFRCSVSPDDEIEDYMKIYTNEQNYEVKKKFPPPSLPEIKTSVKFKRLKPLTKEEFDLKYKFKSKKSLAKRIFLGGILDNDLRKIIWPILLGIKNSWEDNDWLLEENCYKLYLTQWTSITLDQESRFSAFKEFKSMAERDVIRCDRGHDFFQKHENVNLLKEILMCYVMHDFNTGYVQGMTDLAAPLLFLYNGESVKSFWCFTSLLNFTRKNFEMSQKNVKKLLKMLFKIINLTDPCFAQYLNSNESANCYFAFRWLICLFKREFVKGKNDNYGPVLHVWDIFWSLNAYQQFFNNEIFNKFNQEKIDENEFLIKENFLGSSPPFIDYLDKKRNLNLETKLILNNESVSKKDKESLTNIELFFLAMSLAIIRQERDFIFSKKLDASDILKHFNTLNFVEFIEMILDQATKIWCWLKFDGGEEQLYKEQNENEKYDSIINLEEPFDLLNDDYS